MDPKDLISAVRPALDHPEHAIRNIIMMRKSTRSDLIRRLDIEAKNCFTIAGHFAFMTY